MITPAVRGAYVANVEGIVPHRKTKHCVCVSVAKGKYMMINTQHGESYDDFLIRASDYDFLMGEDRFLSCVRPFSLSSGRLIRKVGALSVADTHRLADKVIRSKTIPKPDRDTIIGELQDALREQ